VFQGIYVEEKKLMEVRGFFLSRVDFMFFLLIWVLFFENRFFLL